MQRQNSLAMKLATFTRALRTQLSDDSSCGWRRLGGGKYAVATASGISAILALCVTHLREGDHVLCPRYIFGTVSLFENTLGKFGVDITVVSPTRADAWREAATTKTRLWFFGRHRIR